MPDSDLRTPRRTRARAEAQRDRRPAPPSRIRWIAGLCSAGARALLSALEWRMSHELADLRRRYNRT